MTQEQLTDRQALVLWTISDFHEKNGYPPSIRELAARIGVRSLNTIYGHLDALITKGYLERDAGRMRGLRLLKSEKPSRCCPTCGQTLKGPLPE